MLDPDWVRSRFEDFDVFHLDFGFDAQSPTQLTALVDALRQHGKPSSTRSTTSATPNRPNPTSHDAALEVIIPAADRLVTLTPGAAESIRSRWNRTATVLPHPHVVDLPGLARPRPYRNRFRVGVHAKSLRPNMAVLPVVQVLAHAVAELPDAELHVNIHREVADPASRAYAPQLLNALEELARLDRLILTIHAYFGDGQLFDYLTSLDLSVLPYHFGTHPGWLEACHDLGTAVAAPDCGFYAQQRPCLTYGHTQSGGLDAESLREAVRTAYMEYRRAHLSRNVDRLADRITPSWMAGRRNARRSPPADHRGRGAGRPTTARTLGRAAGTGQADRPPGRPGSPGRAEGAGRGAVESVKDTAQEAVATTTEHAQSADRETADVLREVGREAAAEIRTDPDPRRTPG
ncbi:glycosyltransferase family 1 protein [Streptomyces sp. A0592]|uniref:glycosyltransferase family 1 protein n=1 Tax=Streptomyces sp. A0592 TaxID=2563099 RepID=UPI0019D310D8|nr:glycosyltransferase family 1 protein [Streptomyces sp. A0592]